jgi:hypothetical protein
MAAGRELERIASAIDATMRECDAARAQTGWEHVEWLRLKADLFDRLAAADREESGQLARRAELIRDRAERLADAFNRVATARPRTGQPAEAGDNVVNMWARSAMTAIDQ